MIRLLIVAVIFSSIDIITAHGQGGDSLDDELLLTQQVYTGVTAAIFAAAVYFGIKQWRSQKAISQVQADVALAEREIANQQKNTANTLKKSAELQVLSSLFDLLSDIDLSKSRAEIFKRWCVVYGKDRTATPAKQEELLMYYRQIRDDVRKVEGAFDKAGVLVIHEAVERKLFFELYALMVIRTYRALEVHIDREQKKSPAFAYWYSELNRRALNYYKEDLGREPEAIYCDNAEPDRPLNVKIMEKEGD